MAATHSKSHVGVHAVVLDVSVSKACDTIEQHSDVEMVHGVVYNTPAELVVTLSKDTQQFDAVLGVHCVETVALNAFNPDDFIVKGEVLMD